MDAYGSVRASRPSAQAAAKPTRRRASSPRGHGAPGGSGSPGVSGRLATFGKSAKPGKSARRFKPRAAIVAMATCLVLALGAGSAWAYNYTKLDLTWYTNNPDAQEFAIATAGQMQAFSALVNGDAEDVLGNAIPAVSFEGKTVKLANGVNLFKSEFTPVGTKDNPFKGTFDGQGNTVGGLSITQGAQDVGLFGVTGEGSALKNIIIDNSASIKLTSDDVVFEDVGSLVGECGGSIENCTSAAKVRIDYTKADGTTGSVMKNIGGVAGSVQGSASGVQFSGALEAETPANAYTSETDGSSISTVVENVGGVMGSFGSDISSCTNSGTLLLVTSGKSGIDRFGSAVDAKSLYVGGVGGYGVGNVTDCHNTATLFTTSIAGATLADMESQAAKEADGGADGMGGVIGSLRGIAMSGLGDKRGDPGLEEGSATLVLSNCTNTGYVSGLHTVGGIVGSQGSNTVVTRCTNGVAESDATSDVGHVRSTRWNKPATAGICGQSWGIIQYSRNHGQVQNTKTGYFTAGICGMLEAHDAQTTTPEIFACYNTGNVFCAGTNASFYEGGIVGELDHDCYVHDNVFLYGTVSSQLSKIEDADEVAAGRNYGTLANTTVVFETAKQATEKGGICIKSGEAVAILNKLAENDAWQNYYFITKSANNGYPVLNGQATPDGSIDLSTVACSIEFEKNAAYTAAFNPTPSLKVSITVDGKQIELVQGSDYKVVADPNALDESGVCKGITSGQKPYAASIEGIGNYHGTPAATVSYGIDRGNFSECTVSVVNGKWTGQPLNDPTVSVIDAGGAIVGASAYTYVVNNGENCIDSGQYPVTVTANEDSNYQGAVSGTYQIDRADIYKESDVIGLVYENRVWYYDEEECDLYEVIPADASGNALPEGSELQYDANGLPYVVPQTYTNPETGKQATRTTYESEDGRTLTVAEAKNKNTDGSTIYGDMAVDFTGKAIHPACIGVLYPCQTESYNPTLLKGVLETELGSLTGDERKQTSYVVRYGGTGDGGYGAQPRNTNATTSATQPEASVVVNGNNAGNFANYAYMDFRILPITATTDNIKVVQKTASLPYSGGGLPATPATTSNDSGNVNAAVEVRYAPDAAKYDASDESTYCVLDGANWTLEFDHATTAEGEAIAQDSKSAYVAGAKVYYKVVPAEHCSVKGWDSVAIEEPWELTAESNSKIALSNPAIEIAWSSKPYSPSDFYPELKIVNTATGKELVKGTDYKIATVPSKYKKPPEYNSETGLLEGLMRITGKGDYSGNVDIEYTASRGVLTKGILEAETTGWVFREADSTESAFAQTSLVWKENGWSAEELSEVLALKWRNGSSGDTAEAAFKVLSIEQNGQSVDKITEMEKEYVLKVCLDASRSAWFASAELESVDVTVKMETLPLSSASGSLTLYSKAEITPHEYMYTGNLITPQLKVYDRDGVLINGEYFSLVYPENPGKGQPLDVGEYNTPITTESKSDPNENLYPDLRVTGDGIHYMKNATTAYDKVSGSYAKIALIDDWNDLTFKVVAADIADSSKVRIEVDEVFYAVGQEAKPQVRFYDAQTGEQLNYIQGNDYVLTYQNNTQVGSAADSNPPTVVITPTNNGHLVVNGQATNSLSVPFTIKGDGVDVADVAWDYAKTIVVTSDGTLSEPGVIGKITATGEVCAADAYTVELGTYDEATKAFVGKATGWSAGDKAYFRVKGVKSGVLTGTTVLGPVMAVAASDANTFNAGSAILKVQAADTVYTGEAAKPQVKASDNGSALVEGRDFKVACTDVDAGSATAKVCGLGAYAGEVEASFVIGKANMADLEVQANSKTYSGQQLTLGASDVTSVTLSGVELPATDWTLLEGGYGNNVNVADGGTATLVPGTSGNLTGKKQFGFVIDPAPLINDELEVDAAESVTYTGKAIELTASTVAVRDIARNKNLVLGEDFMISGYENNVNVGTATVYLSGMGNYSASANTVTKTFEIAAADFSKAKIEGLSEQYDWCGSNAPIEPAVTVELDGVALPVSDYDVTYGANDEIGAGKGMVTVTPKGSNVAGAEVSEQFDIVVDLSRATVEAIPNGTYEIGGTYEPDVNVSFNGVALTKGTHYSVAYDTGMAGEKTLTVTGIEPCTGKQEVTYSIDGKPLTADMLSVQLDGWMYTGKGIEPKVTLADSGLTADGELVSPVVLVEGTDYEVAYSNNVNATSKGNLALITITGKGNYAGVLTQTFEIAPKPLTSEDITLAKVEAKGLFTGSAVAAEVTIEDGGIVVDSEANVAYVLAEGKDYELACTNNQAVGWACALVAGLGNYTGELSADYLIKGDLSAAQEKALPSVTYTGKAIEPKIELTLGGVTLAEGSDYVVAFEDNVEPGTARVIASGVELYEGEKTVTFAIADPDANPDAANPDGSTDGSGDAAASGNAGGAGSSTTSGGADGGATQSGQLAATGDSAAFGAFAVAAVVAALLVLLAFPVVRRKTGR